PISVRMRDEYLGDDIRELLEEARVVLQIMRDVVCVHPLQSPPVVWFYRWVPLLTPRRVPTRLRTPSLPVRSSRPRRPRPATKSSASRRGSPRALSRRAARDG